MIPGVNEIGGNSKRSEPNGAGGSEGSALSPPRKSPRGQSPLRKFLGSKTPLDGLKIGLNSAKKNYAYTSENTPENLIWKPPYPLTNLRNLKVKGEGELRRGNSGALVKLWSIVKVGADPTC